MSTLNNIYNQIGDDAIPLAGAIIDRITHGSYIINISNINPKNDKSAHDVYDLDKALHE